MKVSYILYEVFSVVEQLATVLQSKSMMLSGIRKIRHDRSGRSTTQKIQDLLIRAATQNPLTNELRQFLNFHDDFNGLSLEAQRIVIDQLQNESDVERVTVLGRPIADVLKNIRYRRTTELVRSNYLIKSGDSLNGCWTLVVPATSTIAELFCFASRKDLLEIRKQHRIGQGQSRLNSLFVLHCHQEQSTRFE